VLAHGAFRKGAIAGRALAVEGFEHFGQGCALAAICWRCSGRWRFWSGEQNAFWFWRCHGALVAGFRHGERVKLDFGERLQKIGAGSGRGQPLGLQCVDGIAYERFGFLADNITRSDKAKAGRIGRPGKG
jgi:hypothetical protein